MMVAAERARRAADRYGVGELSPSESSETEKKSSSQRMLFDLPAKQGKNGAVLGENHVYSNASPLNLSGAPPKSSRPPLENSNDDHRKSGVSFKNPRDEQCNHILSCCQ